MALLKRNDPDEGPLRLPLDGVLAPREFGRLGAVLLGSAALIGLGGLGVLLLSGRDAQGTGFHPAVVLSLACGTVAGCALIVWRAKRFYTTPGALIMGVAIVIVAASAYYSGSRASPFASLFFLWVGTAFVLLPNWVAVVEVAFAGVLDAIVLAVQPGHTGAFGSWVFTFGVTALTAWVIKNLVDAVMLTASNERAARAEAQAANDELEEVNQRETEFLSRMSHEVRTPLNAIIGFSDMLGEGLVGALNEQQTEHVAEVQASGRHLLELIGDVMDVAKVEAGREDLELAEFDLRGVLVPAVSLFRSEAERQGTRLELQTPSAPMRIRGDERKVRQVVLNLLSNAVKFTPAGGTVSVSAVIRGPMMALEVSDTGPGIPADQVEHIFEEYRQAPSGAATRGTGLGLPLARRFAEQHGGTLDLWSRPGRGSRFTVRLPIAGPDGAEQVTAAEPAGVLGDRGKWTPMEHPELHDRVMRLFIMLGAGTVVLGMTTLVVDHISHTTGYRAGPLLMLSAIAVATGGVVAWRASGMTPWGISLLLLIATAGFSGADYFVGPLLQPYGTMLYVWIAIAAVTCLSLRWAAAHMVLVGAAYAVLLAVQPGNPAPVARWMVVNGVVVVSALSVETLLSRLGSLAQAERRTRERLEALRGNLEQAARHKAQFLATMSHELRTPLNAIIGFSEVLEDELFGPLTDKQKEYARDLAEAGHQLLALVNDILDLAKADAGRMELDVGEDVRIADLLATACAAPRRVPVELTCDAERPIDVDEHKFRRMIDNLIDEVAGTTGVASVAVRAESPATVLTVWVEGTGVPRPEPGVVPLRVAVAQALADLHGGRIQPTAAGWCLTLPLRARSRETV